MNNMKTDDNKIKKETEEQDKEKIEENKIENQFESEIKELKLKNEEFENKYKRALADYQNFQRRVNDEKRDWLKIANREMLLRLLPVLDTLILAGKHNSSPELNISLSQFLDILKAEGVTKIEAIGKMFDPQFMEAIDTMEGEEGKVMEETRVGFMIYDKLLRPVQVKVGKKKEKENNN